MENATLEAPASAVADIADVAGVWFDYADEMITLIDSSWWVDRDTRDLTDERIARATVDAIAAAGHTRAEALLARPDQWQGVRAQILDALGIDYDLVLPW